MFMCFRTGGICGNVRRVHVGLLREDEARFWLFSAASFRRCIASGSLHQVNALIFLKLVNG